MLFIIKRLLGQFLSPLPLLTLIFLVGWLIRRFERHRRLGQLLQLAAGIAFLVISVGGFERYLYNLEQIYPPFNTAPEHCTALSGAEIVVLGQGLDPDSTLPIRFRDNDTFRNRMLEAARIAQHVPESRLLVSMAGSADQTDKKTALDEYAQLFNLAPQRLVMLADGVDTESEARLALQVARAKTVIVVTSASHLPRAIPLFQRAADALHPQSTNTPAADAFRFIPAPADFQVRKPQPLYSWLQLPLPHSGYFQNADRLFHETYGRIFEKIRKYR